MGSFDRRWRDTPVKNSSCLLLLHLFVFLSSSIPSSPPPPLCLFPLLKSHLPRSGCAPLLRPGTHEGHHGPLVSRRLRFIPTLPSCLQEAVDRRPVALLAARHTEGAHKSSQAHVERGRSPIAALFGAIFNFQAHVILHTLSSDFDPSSSCDSGSGAAWGHRAPALSKLFHSIIPAFAQYKYHLGA